MPYHLRQSHPIQGTLYPSDSFSLPNLLALTDPWARRTKDKKDKGGGSHVASPAAAANTPSSSQRRSDYLEKGLLEHVMDAVFEGVVSCDESNQRPSINSNTERNQTKVQVR